MPSQSLSLMSDYIHFDKYAKYIEKEHTRESFDMTTSRNKQMHINKFPEMKDEIIEAYRFVHDKKVLPSMRSMQFGGKPIELNNARIFNCSYLPIDNTTAFSEVMFLLLSGCGVGYSVQMHHISKLPELKFPKINPKTGKYRQRKFVISDTIEGWADAVKVLIKAYFNGRSMPTFIYDDIRKKGARLVTSGGKAPGPQPLKDCIHNIKKVLDRKSPGDKLSSLEVHDILCFIADSVLAGGIRRSALISLFSFNDIEMATCKSGTWYEANPQRGRANNSAVILRHRIKESEFRKFFKYIKASNAGEPGIYFSNNQEWGSNPCVEIGLRPFQFCNLVEINASTVANQEDLNERCRAASFIATLQASYTNFHYLREIWKTTTEKDALLGVSMTGIASGKVDNLNLKEAAAVVIEENRRVASIIGINPAARTTCVKPAGTTSCILGTSSGIHAWHNPHFIRRVKVGKNDAIYRYLMERVPGLMEDNFDKPHLESFLSIPIKAPEGSTYRSESVANFLSRVNRFNREWVRSGHINGQNAHNVSATISVKEDDWEFVEAWMWLNRDTFNGLSLFPYSGGSYVQTPFEDIDEDTYNKMYQQIKGINLSDVVEYDDNTTMQSEIACAGGSCELL